MRNPEKIGTTQTVPPCTRPNERRRAKRRHRNHQPPAQALHQKDGKSAYWPMGKGIAIGRFCPCRTKTRRKTLPALYRTEHAADVVHPTPPTAPNKNANAAALNCMSPNSPAKNPRPPTQPIAGPHRRHRQTRLPPRTSREAITTPPSPPRNTACKPKLWA